MDCHLKFLRFPVWNDLRFVWDIEHKSRCTRLSQEVLGVEDRGHGLQVWLQEWRPAGREGGGGGAQKKKKNIWCGGQRIFFFFLPPPPPPARGLLDYGYLERASLGTECHWRVGIPVPAPPKPDTKQVCWVANLSIAPGCRTPKLEGYILPQNPNAYGGPNPFKR